MLSRNARFEQCKHAWECDFDYFFSLAHDLRTAPAESLPANSRQRYGQHNTGADVLANYHTGGPKGWVSNRSY
jgi:hypothetical protein